MCGVRESIQQPHQEDGRDDSEFMPNAAVLLGWLRHHHNRGPWKSAIRAPCHTQADVGFSCLAVWVLHAWNDNGIVWRS